MTQITVRRGLETNRSQVTAATGEPLWTTDTHELWIGDGKTAGGIPVGTMKSTGTVTQGKVNIALYKDTTGRLLNPMTKDDFLKGWATEAFVNDKVTNAVPLVKVNNAAHADKATNSDQLGGQAAAVYVDNARITANYQEDSTSKVVSAHGIKAMYDTVTKAKNDGLALKVDKTAISNSVTSTSTTNVASSQAVKTAMDKANGATTAASTAQSRADAAYADAGKAQTTASSAVSKADTAKGIADSANSKATTAQSTADTARGAAQTAQARADSAYLLAQGADTKAGAAGNAATVAKQAADTAQAQANKGVADAASAHSAATAAQNTANAATPKTAFHWDGTTLNIII